MDYQFITHGSENSLDKDVYVIIPESLPMKDAKKLCDSFAEINANLITIENGKVNWVYKGTVDECNNSILATFNLHKQDVDCPVTVKAERAYAQKMLRTVRGLLSYVSRTELRETIKAALVTSNMDQKIEALKKINLNDIKDFGKSPIIETYKFYAFQMGQTLALLEDNIELFTKNSVAQYYPELADYLARKDVSPEKLQSFFERFTQFVEKSYKRVDDKELYFTTFHGKKEVIDVRKEITLPPVVIFDIDGTLMNEEHRAEYRDKKDWNTYFSLCKYDTPFQHIIDLTHEYKKKGYEVWVMSGRYITAEQDTLDSFAKYGIVFDHLKLRGEGNFIPDYVIKPAWARKYIGLERIEAVYDDSPRVIEAFRKKGLNVINVTDMPLPDGSTHYRKPKV
jgi:hypothetical protein